jgi:hypothetical protein
MARSMTCSASTSCDSVREFPIVVPHPPLVEKSDAGANPRHPSCTYSYFRATRAIHLRLADSLPHTHP